MATVHICDRCGAEIEDYIRDKHKITLYDAYENYVQYRYSQRDLCDNCRKLLEYINDSFIAYDKSKEEILEFLGVDEDGNSVR